MNKLSSLQEIKVSYSRKYDAESITDSHKASEYCREAFKMMGANLDLKEYAIILLLNRSNHLIGYHKLSEGGIDGTVVDLRLAFSVGLKCLANGIILCHCHPSRSLAPSNADLDLTKKFVEAGKLMDIKCLDHIILTSEKYFSFADEGLIL